MLLWWWKSKPTKHTSLSYISIFIHLLCVYVGFLLMYSDYVSLLPDYHHHHHHHQITEWMDWKIELNNSRIQEFIWWWCMIHYLWIFWKIVKWNFFFSLKILIWIFHKEKESARKLNWPSLQPNIQRIFHSVSTVVLETDFCLKKENHFLFFIFSFWKNKEKI